MVRQRKEKGTNYRLQQPDRSDPQAKTLLEIANEKGILQASLNKQVQLDARKLGVEELVEEDDDGEILVGRFGESMLWSISLTMLHLMLDVLVTNQYALEMDYSGLLWRSIQAFPGK